MNNIFITGATGFLGSSLIDEILSSSDDVIYALVRGRNTTESENRLMSILTDMSGTPDSDKTKRSHIKIYTGDITQKNLGLDKEVLHCLINDINIIYHAAAVTDLNLPLKKAREINANGTKNVLELALLCKEKGKLRKVNHISTAYVAGTKKEVFKENDLDVGQEFNNTYEQSKFEAEKLIFQYRDKGLDIDIFRPSIIMGRYTDGKTLKFKMLYQPLHFLALELFDKIPVAEGNKAHLINVDITAKAILLINNLSTKKNMNYHIVSPREPTFSYVLNIASDYFGFKKPDLVSFEEINIENEYSSIQRNMLEPYIPYFNSLTDFDMKNTLDQLTQKEFIFPEFDEKNLIRIFEYCDKSGFIKRKRRNVVVG